MHHNIVQNVNTQMRIKIWTVYIKKKKYMSQLPSQQNEILLQNYTKNQIYVGFMIWGKNQWKQSWHTRTQAHVRVHTRTHTYAHIPPSQWETAQQKCFTNLKAWSSME